MNRRLLLLVGVVLTLAGAVLIAAQALSGAQPWGPTLADNMIFAKSIPFTLGLGVVVGTVAGLAPGVGALARKFVGSFAKPVSETRWMEKPVPSADAGHGAKSA